MNESLKRWLRALTVTLIIFFIISLYYSFLRGNYSIFDMNKVLGSTAVILAGLTLLIGPLRRIPLLVNLMVVRRQLGLLAFGIVIFHVVLSVYQSNSFVWFSWNLNEWIAVVFGIMAITIWGYMAYISRNTKIQNLGADVWKKRISIAGKLGFIAIFFHLTLIGYQDWIEWLHGGVKQTEKLVNPSFPPASFFIFLFMCAIITFRIFTFFKYRTDNQQEGK